MSDTDDLDDTDNLLPEECEEKDKISTLQRLVSALKAGVKREGLKLCLLVIANGLYLYLGGLVFYALERKPAKTIDLREQILTFLQAYQTTSIANSTSLSMPSNIISLVSKMDSADEFKMSKAIREIHEQWKDTEDEEWTVSSSVFFASTVVTTIGYGNLAPESPWGRAFCVIYAVIGIPLTVMLLALVGKILARIINDMCGLILSSVRKYLYPDYEYESTAGETDLNVPVWLACTFLVGFILMNGAIYMYLEKWDFGDSVYFVFITLTTIGFGDLVPHNHAVIWFNVTFLYIGLAAVSITINLIIAHINLQYKKHKQKLRFVEKLQMKLKSDGNNFAAVASSQEREGK